MNKIREILKGIDQEDTAYGGMTLRDYFAAKAMQGELSSQIPDHEWSDLNYLAKHSYTVADAMLKAREQAKC